MAFGALRPSQRVVPARITRRCVLVTRCLGAYRFPSTLVGGTETVILDGCCGRALDSASNRLMNSKPVSSRLGHRLVLRRAGP